MKYFWSVNLYDSDGDVNEKCVLVHAGEQTILKFKNSEELEDFAKEIFKSLHEMRETHPNII